MNKIISLVNRIISNYLRKYNEIFGDYRRKRFAITVGDELPTGVLQLAKVQIAQKREKLKSEIS